jgi:hypothetical protein
MEGVMKVRVTKAEHWNWYKKGDIVEVHESSDEFGNHFCVGNRYNGINKENFESMDEQPKFPFKVKCIDNKCWEHYLEEGQIYTAVGDNRGIDYFIEGHNQSYKKSRFEIVSESATQDEEQPSEEYTGSSVSYYKVEVTKPTNPDSAPYVAECNDIIEALNMNYAEGNAFKAIWRSCAARALGVSKKGYDDGLYDAEKVVFFGTRMVEMAKK